MNGYTYSNNSPVTLSDPSGQRPDCFGECLKNWAEGVKEGKKEKEAQDRIDDDINAKCNAACAKRRTAKAASAKYQRAGIEYANPNIQCAPSQYISFCWHLWGEPEEEVVATGGEEDLVLDDVPVSPMYGGEDAGHYVVSDSTSDAQSWASSLATKGSVTVELPKTKLGVEETFIYTWSDTQTVTHTTGQTIDTEKGRRGYLAPTVRVKWEQVNYYKRDANGNRVFVNTSMRMNVQFTGTASQSFVGKGPTGGNTADDVGASILSHLG